MTSLEQRLSEATGPDRELDAYLWGEMEGWTVHEVGDHILVADKAEQVQRVIGYADPGKTARNVTITAPDIPPYTSSIDAALALVERKLPGWSWSVSDNRAMLCRNWSDDHARVYRSIDEPPPRHTPFERWPEPRPTTPPLALCLALVRALAHKERA